MRRGDQLFGGSEGPSSAWIARVRNSHSEELDAAHHAQVQFLYFEKFFGTRKKFAPVDKNPNIRVIEFLRPEQFLPREKKLGLTFARRKLFLLVRIAKTYAAKLLMSCVNHHNTSSKL